MPRMNRQHLSIPIAGLEPTLGDNHQLCVGDQLFIQHQASFLAISLARREVAWSFSQVTAPPASFFQVPRRLRTSGRRIWVGGECVVHLFDTADGVRVQACDRGSGQVRWHRDFVTPSPLPWTEAAPAWPGAETEELGVFLAGGNALIVAIERSSRRRYQTTHPLPPLHSRLELTRLSPASGEVLWTAAIDEPNLPMIEKRDLQLVSRAGDHLVSVDVADGALRTHGAARAGRGWPRPLANGIVAPWQARGRIGLDAFSGAESRSVEWRRPGVKTTVLHALDDLILFQVNESILSALGDDLRPLWEARVTTFIWGVASIAGGPIFVATCGAGGGLYVVERASGKVISERRTHQGAWDVLRAPEANRVVTCTGEGLLVADASSGECQTIAVPDARVLAGSWDHRIVVLTGGSVSGVALVKLTE